MDVTGTALAVQAFAVGLPPLFSSRCSPRAFSRGKTPGHRCALLPFPCWSMLSPVSPCSLRSSPVGFGHVGLAAATGLAGWINAILLMIALRKSGGLEMDARCATGCPDYYRSRGHGGFVACAEIWADQITALFLDVRLLALMIVTGVCAGIYGLIAMAIGALRPSEALGSLKRQ